MVYSNVFECDNDIRIILTAYSRNTRHGFAHDAEIMVRPNKDGFCRYYITAHCYYLNRTWEKYTYQTVLQRACHMVMEKRADELKPGFMYKNGYKKLTKKRAAEFTETLNNDAEYTAINSVLQQL